MDFQQQKQRYLAELASGERDKSKKGFIDAEIKALVDEINAFPSYYTTSSCSGRILLYSISSDRKKNQTEWIFVSHNIVSFSGLKKTTEKLPQEIVFFRFEPLILHVVCCDLAAAEGLLQLCNDSGLKHSGAISLGERIVVEIIGNDRLDAPIAKDGKLLLTDEAFSFFVADANEKMNRNLERIERLLENVRKIKLLLLH